MRLVLFFLLFGVASIAHAQIPSFNKDSLYLRFDTLQTEGVSTDWFAIDTKQYKVIDYNYFPLKGGSNLKFVCNDKTTMSCVPQSTLGNYPVRTLEQLKTYISTLTYQQALTYLEKMKRYYIVEILPNGTAEIIPVKLDMQID